MIEASCHCGSIRLQLPQPPTELTDCNCSICRRYGALWAYYPTSDVNVLRGDTGTTTYSWGNQMLEFHRCSNCGCVTHWAATEPVRPEMGVNARLFAPEVTETVPVRIFDGAATLKYL